MQESLLTTFRLTNIDIGKNETLKYLKTHVGQIYFFEQAVDGTSAFNELKVRHETEINQKFKILLK